MTEILPQPPLTVPKEKPFQKSTSVWIDPDTRNFRSRAITVRGNMKGLKNTLEPVYGCQGGMTNQGYGCPWGCYAKFTCKKLNADFDTPIPQKIGWRDGEPILIKELRKVKKRGIDWVRLGVMGDPSHDWDFTVRVIAHVRMAGVGLTPVLFTRFWEWPTQTHLRRMARWGTNLHMSICAFDGMGLTADGVPVARGEKWVKRVERLAKRYTKMGGKAVWRAVTFHFDDEMDEAEALWERQDELMSREHVLEQPARIMKGKKHTNPIWKYVPLWAYFKAPRTSDHKFSPQNHNWTAGVLYDRPACWVGCKECDHWCLTR